MSNPTDLSGRCDCVVGESDSPSLSNPPGLSQLSYRLATYSQFRRRMIEQLPRQTVPPFDSAATNRPLGALTTRNEADATIALLDAWAMCLDVMSFYQERIANEGFLRTAIERRSILELARACGHELHPGVAATTYLAFTADDSPSAPPIASIPAGTKVESLPGSGEKPQIFETTRDFAARASNNQLRPRLTQPQTLRLVSTAGGSVLEGSDGPRSYLYLAGASLNIKAGDMLLLVDRRGSLQTLVLPVNRVSSDAQNQRTRVDFSEQPASPVPPLPGASYPAGEIDIVPAELSLDYVNRRIINRFWSETSLRSQIALQRWNEDELLKVAAQVISDSEPGIEVYALRQRVGFFGNSAPFYASLSRPGTTNEKYPYANTRSYDWEPSNGRSIWKRSVTRNAGDTDYADMTELGADVFLERSVSEVVAGSLVYFRGPSKAAVFAVRGVTESSLSEFAVSGKATGLLLALPQTPAVPLDASAKAEAFFFRTTAAYVQSERLELASLPVEAALTASTGELTLAGMVMGLDPGQPVWIHGLQEGVPDVQRDEITLLGDVYHQGGNTTLRLATSLRYSYERASVRINSNVVPATHGETLASEVLGSGDAAQQNQSFALKVPNVTFLSTSSSDGTDSTVSVTVNGVQWQEVPSLWNIDGRSQSFTLRVEDDGSSRVIFGDGEHGARLPSGRENIIARYRTCDASLGAISAGRLSLFKNRPLGIRTVTNPLAATGNSAPETTEQGRKNAPLETVLLGRIVTLRDYEGFASAFPGIGKAYAQGVWDSRSRVVHITVAGIAGAPVDPRSDVHQNLLQAIYDIADPAQSVAVASYASRYFSITAELILTRGSQGASVLAAARAALLSAFSFERRRFAQPVTAAEVAKVLQAVPGVAASVLRRLAYLSDPDVDSGPPAQLLARNTFFDVLSGVVQPAELLVLPPIGILLSESEA
jgi:hypothetical protein